MTSLSPSARESLMSVGEHFALRCCIFINASVILCVQSSTKMPASQVPELLSVRHYQVTRMPV